MTLTTSQADWLRVRSYLQEHRHALAVDAAGDYPDERRMAGTPLLAAPEWQPAGPVPLHDIELEFIPSADPMPVPAGVELPERPDGTRYRSYSEALRDLAAPAVFENRPTYRLTEADLTKPRLAFDLLLYTGVRRSDAVRLGPQMERDGKLVFSEKKGRSRIVKTHELPILPPLRRSIDATKKQIGHLVYLVSASGQPQSAHAFGCWFIRRCREAGLARSAHGLRKLGAQR